MDLQQPQLFGFLGFFMVWTVTSSIQTFSFSCTQSSQHVRPTNGDMLTGGLYPDHILLNKCCKNWHSGQVLDLGCHEHVLCTRILGLIAWPVDP